MMHMGAINAIMLRATPEVIDKYIRPLNGGYSRDALVLRPRDGQPLLVPDLVEEAERVDGYNASPKASWTTSGGFAELRPPDHKYTEF